MKRFKWIIFNLFILSCIGFSSYRYSSTKKVKVQEFITQYNWGIKNTIWNGVESEINNSQFLLKLHNNFTFEQTDILGNIFEGNWKFYKNKDEKDVIILDEGTHLEETYKIISYNLNKKELRLEKINSKTGSINLGYALKATN
ncbi:hypothetical protein [Flexithrix dorotheae]|uniref:hypothetical protein n=1 Tax=Flexithrix dorotheae TaxID=70993 RepID=UPI00036D5447|nr:hypothetical protein [Flexithrix dorotheae]